jgi:hypothetical protein
MRTTLFTRGAVLSRMALVGSALTLSACSDAPTTAVVENDYPIVADAGAASAMTVFKAWWVTTLFPNAVGPAAVSEAERTVPASDFAYVLLAPGWSPDDPGAPRRLVAMKSAAKLTVATHDALRIAVSDDLFVGNCAAGKPLGADDARLIVERIFPEDFAGVVYDPQTCTSLPTGLDAGAAAD